MRLTDAIDAGQDKAAIPLLEGVVTRDQRDTDAYTWLADAVRKDGGPARGYRDLKQAIEAFERKAPSGSR